MTLKQLSEGVNMTQLDTFIVHGHEKIIAHYRWLRDTAKSEAERERFQQCMAQEEQALQRVIGQRSDPLVRAA